MTIPAGPAPDWSTTPEQVKAEKHGAERTRRTSATRDARQAAAEALEAAQNARQAAEIAQQGQREVAGLRELCGQQAAGIRALASMLTQMAARLMHQPPGDEPAALAMLAARDGHDDALQVLRLAGYGDDHPGVQRLAMDGGDWQVPAPEQVSSEMSGNLNVRPKSPGDPYPAWQRARFGAPAHERQPEPAGIWSASGQRINGEDPKW